MSKHRNYLVGGAVVSGILVLATTVVTVSSIGKATKLREHMQRSFATLQSYFQRDPFPDAKNVEAEEAKLETQQEWYEALREVLSSNAVVVKGMHTPGSFSKTCEDTINSLRKLAPKGEAGDSVVDGNFNFGFDRYDLSQNGSPAARKDVPRLLRQLEMVDRLVRVMYGVELIKLEQVLREEFDLAGGDEHVRVTRGRGRVGRRSAAASTSTTSVSLDQIEVEPIEDAPFDVDRQRFGFVFIIREEALFKLIGVIDSMWPFALISSLDFQKTTSDVVFDKKGVTAAADSGIVRPPLGKTSRIVSGALREAPVRVAMTVDIYTLGAGDNVQDSD